MKKKDANKLKFINVISDNIYKTSKLNIVDSFINDNSIGIKNLNREISEMLNKKWLYIKNKRVYYNVDINALLPDLLVFPIGFSKASEQFNDNSIKLEFGGYKGRLITYAQLLKILDKDCCVQKIRYYNYTFFLNGIKYINEDNICDIRSFNDKNNMYLSYNIPIFELGKDRVFLDENGYDLKYIKSKDKIEGVSDIVNLWLQYELVPKGLTRESEELYLKLMKLV